MTEVHEDSKSLPQEKLPLKQTNATGPAKEDTIVSSHYKPARPSARTSLPLVLAACAALRLALFHLGDLASALEKRPELATPLTSIRSLREGVYIWKHGGNPYDGGVFYHSPLYLGLFSILSPNAGALTAALWTVVDLGTACGLVAVARSRAGPRSRDTLVAAVYLLNPYTILSCLGRSTTSIDNSLLVLAIASLSSGSESASLALLAVATHTSLYPVLLLPAFLMVMSSRRRDSGIVSTALHIFSFLACLALGVAASYLLVGDWSWVRSTWGTIITVSDLTPNVGVWWYFFTEMFDHFRNFFVGVFQLHVVIYVAPICIRLRHDPLFAITVLLGVIGTFKSYPALGDTAVWAGLLACFPEVISNLRHPLVTVTTHLYTLLLLPLLHSLWLLTGTGNANFFYAATLVYAVANGMGVIDMLGAGLKAQVKQDAGGRLGLSDDEDWDVNGFVPVQYTGI